MTLILVTLICCSLSMLTLSRRGAERLTHAQELALRATIGEADYRHRSPRETNVLLVNHDLAGWDSLFLENVTRDGIVLWSRGTLPDALKPVQARR